MIGFLSESPLSFEVMFHSGSYLFEITQRQLLIDGLCRFERMGLELFESHFDEVSLRNQRFVRLVMFVQRPVVEQNFMLQFLVGDALQPDRGERIAEETACGFEYGVGIADQVDELCIGIQLEQGFDPPRMGRILLRNRFFPVTCSEMRISLSSACMNSCRSASVAVVKVRYLSRYSAMRRGNIQKW